MVMSKVFEKRLSKEIKLYIMEMRYGCNDCLKCKGLCKPHEIEALDITTNPRKYINITNLKDSSDEKRES